MATLWSRAGIALLLALAAACSPQPTPQQQVDAQETAALQPLKTQYPDIVVAFDMKGATQLDISIDANGYISTGDNDVDKFKALAIRDWRSAWIAAHPHEHATLTLRLVDFMGRTWATEHAQA
ncbi:MAG TPA: hypothetical protein VF741_07630 [Candidatus Aquilonibacter sp.]